MFPCCVDATGMQFRLVSCVNVTNAVVANSYCTGLGLTQPSAAVSCGNCSVCSPAWLSIFPDGAATFKPCSGHGNCSANGQSCTCATGWGDPLCNTPASCLAAGGRSDAAGVCCPNSSPVRIRHCARVMLPCDGNF